MLIHQDTIVAISSGQQNAAIGIVRLSGADAITITEQLFRSKKLSSQASHTLHFGYFYETPKCLPEELIDEVVISIFHAGKSFTGENTIEISAHGSPYILSQILNALIRHGARPALPGEFTQRAFLNGKMDLTQAEAVADLIASESKAAHDLALKQMRGGVSNELELLRERLIHFTALIELELDFSDEDVAFADRTELQHLIVDLKSKIKNLITSFEYGNAIKNGVPVAIIGKPNAGKSTLLNALLKEERAIVSDIAGTTRDTIEEAITLQGITFRFIDTAGIRDTDDTIEAIGVQKAKEKVTQAKVVLHLFENDIYLLYELQNELKDKIVYNIKTKADMNGHFSDEELKQLESEFPDYHHISISAKENTSIEQLTESLVQQFASTSQEQCVIISNIRHKDALEKSLKALQEVEEGMQMNLSGDLLAIHLKDALYQLGTITGRIEIDKDILGAIFGKFCIGK